MSIIKLFSLLSFVAIPEVVYSDIQFSYTHSAPIAAISEIKVSLLNEARGRDKSRVFAKSIWVGNDKFPFMISCDVNKPTESGDGCKLHVTSKKPSSDGELSVLISKKINIDAFEKEYDKIWEKFLSVKPGDPDVHVNFGNIVNPTIKDGGVNYFCDSKNGETRKEWICFLDVWEAANKI